MRRSPSPVRAGSPSVDKKRQKIKSERIDCDNKKEHNNHIEFPKDQRENKYSKTWKIKGEKQSGNESRESDSDNSRQSRKLLKSLDSIKKEHKKTRRRSTSSSGSSSSSRRSCSSTRRKKIIKKEKRDKDEHVENRRSRSKSGSSSFSSSPHKRKKVKIKKKDKNLKSRRSKSESSSYDSEVEKEIRKLKKKHRKRISLSSRSDKEETERKDRGKKKKKTKEKIRQRSLESSCSSPKTETTIVPANSNIKIEPSDIPNDEKLPQASLTSSDSTSFQPNATLDAINRVLKKQKRSQTSKCDEEITEIIIDGPKSTLKGNEIKSECVINSEREIKVETIETSDDDIVIVPCDDNHSEKDINHQNEKIKTFPADTKLMSVKEEKCEKFEYYYIYCHRKGSETEKIEVSFTSSDVSFYFEEELEEGEDCVHAFDNLITKIKE